MGSPWKMPEYGQTSELFNGTTRAWTSINGVIGWKLMSNTNPTKYIFLPAGGLWNFTDWLNLETHGHYCTTRYATTGNTYNMQFTSTGYETWVTRSTSDGCSVCAR